MTDVNLNHGVGLNAGANSLDIQGEQTGLNDANGNTIQPNNQATGLGVGAEYSFRVSQADRRFAFGAGLGVSKTFWQQRSLAALMGEENFEPVQVDEPEASEDDPFGSASAPSEGQNDASTDGVNNASMETMILNHARLSVFGEGAYQVSDKVTLALRAGIAPIWFQEAYAPTSNRDGTNNYGLSKMKTGLLFYASPRVEVDVVRTKHGTLQVIAALEAATGSTTAVSNGLSSDFRTIPGALSVSGNGGLRWVFGKTAGSVPARTIDHSKAQALLTAYDMDFKENHPGVEDACGPIDPRLLDTATLEGYGVSANPLAKILDLRYARRAGAWYYSLGVQTGEDRLASYADFAACDEQSTATAPGTATAEETVPAGQKEQAKESAQPDTATKPEESEPKTEPKKEGVLKKLFGKLGKKKEQTETKPAAETTDQPAGQTTGEAPTNGNAAQPDPIQAEIDKAKAEGVPVQIVDFDN